MMYFVEHSNRNTSFLNLSLVTLTFIRVFSYHYLFITTHLEEGVSVYFHSAALFSILVKPGTILSEQINDSGLPKVSPSGVTGRCLKSNQKNFRH